MEIQHVNVKLMLAHLDEPVEVFLGRLIPVFHAWIQDQREGDLLLDVADYRHVPAGPGIIVIGHQGNYSVDNTDGRLSVRYNRKAALEGTNQDRLVQAARAAIAACRRLEDEPLLGGKLRFEGHQVELVFNDRLLTPNLDTVRQSLRPELETFARKLFGSGPFSLSYVTDSRSLLTGTLTAQQRFSAGELLANLDS